ncbi:MAG: formylglycine-generating enzyme family protein [Bacteroidales bacterium]|jgi:formylglycine-generating enzyme required for sulfatase activity|nr:formylglycine-generating enzyme family protein [Bacteroidales bacterium]
MFKSSILHFICVSLCVICSAQNKSIDKGLKDSDFVLVAGGTFLMGCDASEECYPDERPQHEIRVDSFYIYKYEITTAQYRLFCEKTNRKMPPAPSFKWQDTYPMVNITWQEAAAYAKWVGGRLPTEAEWEYAARGGSESEGFTYSGGNNYDAVGWCYENSGGSPQSVGQKRPNELGIYDMSGNVWEWCSDNYGIYYYAESPADNPKGAASPASGKVNRGGGFSFDYSFMKTTARRGSATKSTGSGTGFRVVRDVSRR